jgi:hypothetical protein
MAWQANLDARRFAKVCAGFAIGSLVACGPAGTGSTRTPRSVAPATAPSAAAPAPALPPGPLSLLAPVTDPPPPSLREGAIGTLVMDVERMSLPKSLRAIVAVTGRAADDVWLLSGDGTVLNYDGKRSRIRGKPRCFADTCCARLVNCAKKPEACKPDCSLGYFACASQVEFSELRVEDGDVIARAIVDTGGLRGAVIDARLSRGFVCEQAKDDWVYPGSAGSGDGAHAQETVIGQTRLRFQGPARLVNALGGWSLELDGRRVPLPDDRSLGGVAARSTDDLWLWSRSGLIWRGNGLTWEREASPLSGIRDLWMTGRAVWALGDEDGLARFTAAGIEVFSVPETEQVVTGGDTFWVYGKTAIYQWDGTRLGRADAPLQIERAWRDEQSGALWLVGGDNSRTLKTATGTTASAAAVRVLR